MILIEQRRVRWKVICEQLLQLLVTGTLSDETVALENSMSVRVHYKD